MAVKTSSRVWGRHHDEDIFLFRLENESGAYAEISNYGATVVSVVVPDKRGRLENVVTGFPELDGYSDDTCYIGSTIGRYANRITGAKFELDGRVYYLDKNDGGNTNHGGESGFNYRIFSVYVNDDGLKMSLQSVDGDGGYPGNLNLEVIYTWNDNNELLINYKATTDKTTIANFTNHAYFNLSGLGDKIFNHCLTINADHTLHSWDDYTPSGAILPTAANAFCNARLIDKFKIDGSMIEGLNLFYILDKADNNVQLNHAATLSEEASGRKLEVFTDYPGVFLYTGDHLRSSHLTHTAKQAQPFDGLCLECQHYPDSINQPNFPQAVLQAGEVYNQNILFKFALS